MGKGFTKDKKLFEEIEYSPGLDSIGGTKSLKNGIYKRYYENGKDKKSNLLF